MFDIWRNKEKISETAYQRKNYKFGENPLNNLCGGHCVIFCSSNDIWYPNTKEAFEESIIKRDRYEWTNIDCHQASKKIYIRDIYKSWYVTGINSRIDTIDKLVDYLRKETEGYKVITIGSSSGGYMAALLSYLLKAEYAIAFSAQFELRNNWAMDVNPYLQKYNTDEKRAQYYDLKPLLTQSNIPIFYIVPVKCNQDIYHWQYIKDVPCVRCLTFSSKHHGVVLFKNNLSKFISTPKEDLEYLFAENSGKSLSPFIFSIKIIGLISTLQYFITTGVKVLKRRIFK